MAKVLVDGVEYIPSNSALQIEQIKKVLEGQGWMSSSAIDGIIKSLENLEKSSDEKPKPSKCYERPINYDNIVFPHFDKDRHILFEHGGRKGNRSVWTVHQLLDIRQELSGKTNPYDYVGFLKQKHGLSDNIVRTLVFNIVEGHCDKLFRMWDEYKFKAKPSPAPKIVNNPEKRKEMGWF